MLFRAEAQRRNALFAARLAKKFWPLIFAPASSALEAGGRATRQSEGAVALYYRQTGMRTQRRCILTNHIVTYCA
jgi:hypothetical protein